MSQFKRTRSKVWWGDSPPDIGSPIPEPARRNFPPEPEDWAPQLPHYISPIPAPRVVVSPPEQWPQRHGSPGSHKSQDSGFSDSDTSPPNSQYHSSPDIGSPKTPGSKSTNSSDSNNNENITVKHISCDKHLDKSVDKSDVSVNELPQVRFRSSSVIQTTYDFEKYINVHCEQDHIKKLNEDSDTHPTNDEKFVSNVKVNNNLSIKTAKVKDLDTSKNQDNIEYLQVSDNDEMLINNKPRTRSPITQGTNETFKKLRTKEHDFRRSTSYEDEHNKDTNFNREKRNKSFGAIVHKKDDEYLQKSKEYKQEIISKLKDNSDLKITYKFDRQKVKTEKKSNNFRIISNRFRKNTVEDLDVVKETEPIVENEWVLLSSNERLLETSGEKPVKQFRHNVDTPNLDMELNMACMSTPKMLDPHEFMANAAVTPKHVKKSQVRRKNLLKAIEVCQQSKITPLEKCCQNQPDSVQYWLCDTTNAMDDECMTTLQSKPIGDQHKGQDKSSSATLTGNIRKVQTHGEIIVHQYSEVVRSVELEEPCEDHICLTVANINEFVLTHSITLNSKPSGDTPERWEKIKGTLDEYLKQLIDLGSDIRMELNETCPEFGVILNHLDSMLNIFAETIKAVQIQQLKALASFIEDPPSDIDLKSTLTSINHLVTDKNDIDSDMTEKCQEIISSIRNLPFVECEVPRALLIALIDTNRSSIKALALRALATICVTGEAVKQFDEGGGLDIISEILNDHKNPEPQLREAVTVLAQTTAPWLSGHYELRQLHCYLESFVKNITAIIGRTKCCQFLLLCTACLVNLIRESNLTDMDSNPDRKQDIVDYISKHDTVSILLKALKGQGSDISVFLKEQSAQFFYVLASTKRGAKIASGVYTGEISQKPVTSLALVCFLRVRFEGKYCPATARMLRYTVEAIQRLTAIEEFSSQLIQLEAIPLLCKLVRLQKSHSKFFDKHGEVILVACLKSLRTIHRHFPDVFKGYQQDFDEMVRPLLMESILLFSSKKASYV